MLICHFSGITLSGITLSGITLSRIALSGIALNWIALSGIVLSGIALSVIALSGIALSRIALSGIGLSGIALVRIALSRLPNACAGWPWEPRPHSEPAPPLPEAAASPDGGVLRGGPDGCGTVRRGRSSALSSPTVCGLATGRARLPQLNKGQDISQRQSVADPWHFGVDPDPDPRINTSV